MKRFCLALFLVLFLASGVWGETRIGIVTDTRYDRVDYPDRADVVQKMAETFNSYEVETVLHLGDAYSGNFDPEGDTLERIEDYVADKNSYEPEWQNITAPVYWIIGDYDRWGISPDFYVENSTYCPALNFTFDLAEWRFICYSNVGSKRAATDETLVWLENALESARAEGKKIIVCTHCRIDEDYSEEKAFPFSYNADEQRSRINAAVAAGADVKYVFQGHHQVNAHASVEGVEYYTFKNAGDSGSCAVVEIQDDDSLIILGFEEQNSYNINHFYVDGKNGNDDNSGIARDQAWKTLEKANTQIGDGHTVTVLPHTYRESLKPRPGAEGSPKKWIFETGCKLSGADEFADWSEDADANGWYTAENVTTEVKILFEDGVRLDEGDHATAAAAGIWDWNGETLYYRPSSDTPGDHTVEGGQRDWVLGGDANTEYLTIEGGGLEIYGSNKDGIRFIGGDASVSISNFSARDNAEAGIIIPSYDASCQIRLSRFMLRNNNHGIYLTGIASPLLTYGVIIRNSDSGVVARLSAGARIYNAVIAFNGKGMNLQNTEGEVELRNVIIWNNYSSNFRSSDAAQNSVSDAYIPSSPEIEWGNTSYEKIYSDDPLFVSPKTDDFRIQRSSPCIDAGVAIIGVHDQTGLKDAAGNPITLPPDIGAYEHIIINDLYVDGENGSDDNFGTARDQAWKTLAKANEEMESGQTVTVLPHTYRESFKPKPGVEGSPKKWIFETGCKLSGADEFANWSEDADANGWYTADNVTTEVKILFEDGVRLGESDYASAATAGSWDWNGEMLYYRPSSGTPGDHTVEGGQRDWVLGGDANTEYLTIEGGGLEIYGSNKDGIRFIGGDASVSISNFSARDNAEAGIIIPSYDASCQIRLSRFMISDNNHGIFLTGVASPLLSYGLITHNTDSGLLARLSTEAKVYNVVLAYNGRGLNLQNTDGEVELKNIISRNNTLYNFSSSDEAQNSITDSHIPIWPEAEWGNAVHENIYQDNPLFADSEAGDFWLEDDSPYIDAGVVVAGLHDQAEPAEDIEGNLVTDTPDIGAYEHHVIIREYYVDGKNGSDDNSGLSSDEAWKTLSKASDAIGSGQPTITVAPSIYRESFTLKGGTENAPVRWIFESGCKISGTDEFSNWSETPDDNGWYTSENVETEVTLLLEDDVKLGEGDHTAAAAEGSWDWADNTLYYSPSSGSPGDHTVEGGQRDWGITCDSDSEYLTIDGGGLEIYGCGKSGIYFDGCDASVAITGFISRDNAENGVYLSGNASPVISYGLMTGNAGSGMLITDSSEAKAYNVVLAFNGNGIRLENTGGGAELKNIITRYNTSYDFRSSGDVQNEITDSYVPSSPEPEWGSAVYENIYTEDPLFVDPDAGNFQLQEASPCIDTGATVPGIHDQAGLKDVAGNWVSMLPDIGAYEYTDAYVATLADAIVVLKIVTGTPSLSVNLDIDGDKRVGLEEAVFILLKLSGIIR